MTAVFACLAARGAAQQVTLSEINGGEGRYYSIEGTFDVEASQGQVWTVLTDYGALKGVVSSMLESRVLERKGSSVMVEQLAQGRFLFFRKSIRLRLSVEEAPQDSLSFVETSGRTFRLYHGSWTLNNMEGRVRVTYRLNVSSAALAPAFIEKGIFEDNALSLLRELKAEIVRRSAAQASTAKKTRS